MSEVKYKSIEDHIYLETVPANWTGYDVPQVTVKVKKGDLNEFEQTALISVLGEALLRWSALTQRPLKAEVKQ